jgi:hypothetical protein
VLEQPKHGTLEDGGTFVTRHGVQIDTGERNYWYIHAADYLGEDRATLLVEIGGYKVKVVYFFHVEKGPLDNEDEEITCPKSYWKISFNNNDPTGQLPRRRRKRGH